MSVRMENREIVIGEGIATIDKRQSKRRRIRQSRARRMTNHNLLIDRHHKKGQVLALALARILQAKGVALKVRANLNKNKTRYEIARRTLDLSPRMTAPTVTSEKTIFARRSTRKTTWSMKCSAWIPGKVSSERSWSEWRVPSPSRSSCPRTGTISNSTKYASSPVKSSRIQTISAWVGWPSGMKGPSSSSTIRSVHPSLQTIGGFPWR